MGVLAVISLVTGISSAIPMVLSDALKLKALLAPLGPNITVNIQNLEGAAIVEDDAVVAEVNAWMASKGLPPVS